MSEWTRETPQADGYYWAKWRENRKREVYMGAEVVRIYTANGARYVMTIGADRDSNTSDFLWYNDALLFVPPPFTTSDVVRLKVEGYE